MCYFILLYLLIFVQNHKHITSALVCWTVSQMLLAPHRHIGMISVWDFCLLVLYQFPSSFWRLIELVCHSDWYLVSVHRSEKYIAVAHFALALLNLSSSCSEWSRKVFFILLLLFQWIEGYLIHISSLMTFLNFPIDSHNFAR